MIKKMASIETPISDRRQITLPFNAGESLAIDMPGSIYYRPGGNAEAIVSGNPTLLDHVRIEGGKLSLNCQPGYLGSELEVILSGPAIAIWELLGSGNLTLSRLDQPQIRLNIRGSGNVTVDGTVGKVDLHVSGSGMAHLESLIAQSTQIKIRGSGNVAATGTVEGIDLYISGSGAAHLKRLVAQSVQVKVHGSGDAEVTAQAQASVLVCGSGNVALFGRPILRRLQTRGSGRIVQY